jgi:hypothetical protein
MGVHLPSPACQTPARLAELVGCWSVQRAPKPNSTTHCQRLCAHGRGQRGHTGKVLEDRLHGAAATMPRPPPVAATAAAGAAMCKPWLAGKTTITTSCATTTTTTAKHPLPSSTCTHRGQPAARTVAHSAWEEHRHQAATLRSSQSSTPTASPGNPGERTVLSHPADRPVTPSPPPTHARAAADSSAWCALKRPALLLSSSSRAAGWLCARSKDAGPTQRSTWRQVLLGTRTQPKQASRDGHC